MTCGLVDCGVARSVGKTTAAAALIRDPEVGAAFEKLLWVSVSANPNMLELLNALHRQLTGTKLSASVDDEQHAAQEVRKAAKGVRALLVLDGAQPCFRNAPSLSSQLIGFDACAQTVGRRSTPSCSISSM